MNSDKLDYKRIEANGKMYTYQVRTDGRVIKTSKVHLAQSKVTPYMRRGRLMVKIAGREHCVKHLVAAAFIPGYKKGDNVILKDGNPRNCRLDNLAPITKQDLGKITGGDSRRKPVIANGVEYYSARNCAKTLNCSHQTLLDYLNGKVKNSVIGGNEIKWA